MKQTKFVATLLSAAMLFSLAACGGEKNKPTESAQAAAPAESTAGKDTSITLWTYPIGAWKDAATVDGFIAEFNKKMPNIKVKVEYLDYKSGDDQVTAALEAKTAPDIIFEGPERLVANWGAKGKMVDLSDLWTEEAKKDFAATSEAIVNACQWTDGKYYEYPLCMTTHSMGINYDVFEKAGALKYLDEKTRTWTTENFVKAMEAVRDSGLVQTPGIVYCGGQGGDQGTRALAMNLYSAQFTNPEHTEYTMNSENGIKGLQLLVDMVNNKSLSADAGIAAADELQLFANGTSAITLAWNASNKANFADQVKFKTMAMAFPSEDGKPELAGGIWGFGIFNNGDEAKIAAAKEFIKFVVDDKEQGKKSVFATGFFPAKSSVGDIYTGTDKEANTEFSVLMPYLGDYYNVTKGWAEQRTAWWNMLQQIFGGTAVKDAINTYAQNVNAAK